MCLASLALVIRYTSTGTNNPSNSFQVSTSKLKPKLDKFTVFGSGVATGGGGGLNPSLVQ